MGTNGYENHRSILTLRELKDQSGNLGDELYIDFRPTVRPFGFKSAVRVAQYPPTEHYPYPRIELQVYQGENHVTRLAYRIEDQLTMWRAVFKVIVFDGEKFKKIQLLKDLVRELEQNPLPF